MRDSKLEALKSVSLFAGADREELDQLGSLTDFVSVEAGETLVEQGRVGRAAYVIASGAAEVSRGGKHVATLGEGAVVGEMSLVSNLPCNATVTASDAAEVIVIDGRAFRGLLEANPRLSSAVICQLAGRVRELDAQLVG